MRRIEVWRPVVGGEDKYEVSNLGGVRFFRNKRPLTQTEQKGYLNVTIHGKKRTVHSLVLEAFVGPRPAGFVTRHIDNDPANNKARNLEWSTQRKNIADKAKFGTDHNANKTHCPYRHSYSDAYRYTDKNGHARRICRTCQKARSRSA